VRVRIKSCLLCAIVAYFYTPSIAPPYFNAMFTFIHHRAYKHGPAFLINVFFYTPGLLSIHVCKRVSFRSVSSCMPTYIHANLWEYKLISVEHGLLDLFNLLPPFGDMNCMTISINHVYIFIRIGTFSYHAAPISMQHFSEHPFYIASNAVAFHRKQKVRNWISPLILRRSTCVCNILHAEGSISKMFS